MSSAAKLAANRVNAALSTGPSDTSRTRMNSLSHGLTSKQTVITGESQEEYMIFERDLIHHFAPGSPVEAVLADRLIAAAWRLKRFTRVEAAFFTSRIDAFLAQNPGGDPDCALANLFTDPGEMGRMRLFLRYQTSVQREYDTAMRELHKAKAARLKQEYERAALGLEEPQPAAALSNVGLISSGFDAQSRTESEQTMFSTAPQLKISAAAA